MGLKNLHIVIWFKSYMLKKPAENFKEFEAKFLTANNFSKRFFIFIFFKKKKVIEAKSKEKIVLTNL